MNGGGVHGPTRAFLSGCSLPSLPCGLEYFSCGILWNVSNGIFYFVPYFPRLNRTRNAHTV